jgi:hypothetical protein
MSKQRARERRNKKRRQPFLKPYAWPEGMQAGDLVAIAPDGTVVPLCPEVLGDDWATIRARLADIDRSKLLSLADIRRIDDTEN